MNSNEQELKKETVTPTNKPLENVASQSETLKQLIEAEAPLLSLAPGVSVLSPPKPLVEMSQVEMQEWHARIRDHSNWQTMQAHLSATSPVKDKKQDNKKQDISEFV